MVPSSETVETQQKSQQRHYIYNKSGQLTRNRSKRQHLCKICDACNHDIKITDDFCPYCGYKIEFTVAKAKGKIVDDGKKFLQFLSYYDGTTQIPVFLYNYLNHFLIEISKFVQQKSKAFSVEIPLKNINIFIKKRCDVEKNNNIVEAFTQRKIYIPIMTFDVFKYTIKKYREISKSWPQSSYLPADGIYLQACYKAVYRITKLPQITDEDKKLMMQSYQSFIHDKDIQQKRQNKYIIHHVIKAMIHGNPRLIKYAVYDIMHTADISQELISYFQQQVIV